MDGASYPELYVTGALNIMNSSLGMVSSSASNTISKEIITWKSGRNARRSASVSLVLCWTLMDVRAAVMWLCGDHFTSPGGYQAVLGVSIHWL